MWSAGVIEVTGNITVTAEDGWYEDCFAEGCRAAASGRDVLPSTQSCGLCLPRCQNRKVEAANDQHLLPGG